MHDIHERVSQYNRLCRAHFGKNIGVPAEAVKEGTHRIVCGKGPILVLRGNALRACAPETWGTRADDRREKHAWSHAHGRGAPAHASVAFGGGDTAAAEIMPRIELANVQQAQAMTA